MLEVLSDRRYARLFGAQVVALLGTGLLTVGLALAAYDLAGAQASIVLGVALTIKMVAYVGFSPIASALIAGLDRKKVLISADIVRAGAALFLPFIDAVWQIYLIVFVLQAASATFTPAFQAVIPDILPKEADYTKALSLSRLAYDLENIISPVAAGLLLSVIGYHWLFAGTVFGFLLSMFLLVITDVPLVNAEKVRGFAVRLTRGMRIFAATPRLRGLFFLNFAAAAIGSYVIVNTVVIVRLFYAGSQSDVAVALAAFGCGSMIAALSLPRMLERISDRIEMLVGAFAGVAIFVVIGSYVMAVHLPVWPVLLFVWLVSGLSYSAILTPAGRLLRRSAHREDRPALFAAQFALSHACWLITYPLSGFLFESTGPGLTMLVIGLIAGGGIVIGMVFWPAETSEAIEHTHEDLPVDHPHLRDDGTRTGAHSHSHRFVIDDEHRVWPTHG